MANETAALAKTSKHLTFTMGEEEYGLDILKVQEIIGIMPITRIPRTPGFVRGVINLRGKVIPVIDLRTRFGLEAPEDTDRTCIVVVQVTRASGRTVMGIVVDAVSEVIDVVDGEVEPTPEFGEGVETEFILGIAKFADRVVMLLDIDKVLSGSELSAVERIAKKA